PSCRRSPLRPLPFRGETLPVAHRGVNVKQLVCEAARRSTPGRGLMVAVRRSPLHLRLPRTHALDAGRARYRSVRSLGDLTIRTYGPHRSDRSLLRGRITHESVLSCSAGEPLRDEAAALRGDVPALMLVA